MTLSTEDREALEVGASLFGWADAATALRHLEPVVEAMLARREAQVRDAIERAIEDDPKCHIMVVVPESDHGSRKCGSVEP